MRTFVDTSALFALLDEDDANHNAAAAVLASLQGAELVTHAYVLVETLALVSRRLGWAAVERLLGGVMSVIAVAPVEAAVHETALAAYRESGSAAVSFVDRTSFTFMRVNRLDLAFAFDPDFVRAGFTLAS
jgi:predicted nucleic acid-binding protein